MITSTPIHAPVATQIDFVLDCIQHHDALQAALECAATLALPQWYIGAGCVTQTVWNVICGRPPAENVKDLDLVYFAPDEDNDDLSNLAQQALAQVTSLPIDVKNQALVHTWYSKRFGVDIPPYTSTEQAISTWPATVSAIGVRQTAQGHHELCAPFGLHDLLAGVIRPNKTLVTQSVYDAKAARWSSCWPHLRVVGWDET